jgi:hypothetical protein
MSETQVDLGRKNSVMSEGVHTLKIVKSEEKQGPKGPYWNFQLNCTDKGPDDGLSTWLTVSLAEAARWKLDQFLDAVGAPDKGSVSHGNFVGKTLRAKMVWETYNGSVKAKPDAVLPAGVSATASPATASAVPSEAGGASALPPIAGGFKPPF